MGGHDGCKGQKEENIGCRKTGKDFPKKEIFSQIVRLP
jgi:hypothetical protein